MLDQALALNHHKEEVEGEQEEAEEQEEAKEQQEDKEQEVFSSSYLGTHKLPGFVKSRSVPWLCV
jgi:hypothetical protein